MSIAEAALMPICAASGRSRCGVCTQLAASLDPHQLGDLDRMARHVEYAPKEQLFSQGDPATRVFSIAEGVVRIYKLLPDGRRQVVGFALPGDFLGVTTYEQHNLSADAIGPAAACSFPRAGFMRMVEGNLALLRRMNELASRELAAAHDRMMMLGRYTAEEKMAAFVVSWRDRSTRRGRKPGVVPLPMSRRDIADYLGLTIETVSRTFTRLERENTIAVVSGGVQILDEARAQQLAMASPPLH